MAAAAPWIDTWLSAWDLTSQRVLRLPDAPPPDIVFYDDRCVYTTSAVTASGARPVEGPALRRTPLPWRALPHDGSLTLPDSTVLPIQLMSFATSAPNSGPFFVMAAPSYWTATIGEDTTGFTAVFLHEFAHTRQIRAVGARIGPIDAAWPYEEELDDDAVQTHFGEDPDYVAAYIAERDLLYRAADAGTLDETRRLATEALSMMRARQARWFTGDKEIFATLDDLFLAMEGVGQWTACAWLSHPDGGRLDRSAARAKMIGSRRRWTQDEGLALILVVDRLLPEWPSLEFGETVLGATDLLERAVQREH